MLPCFTVNNDSFHFIKTPTDFKQLLLKYIASANRIVLTSLYIDDLDLIHALSRAKDVHILVDYFRATRNHSPLLKLASCKNVKISYFHTTNKVLAHLPRFNEYAGLQHMKLYIFDNVLVTSGANLSLNYFTNRQDRYVAIHDAAISDYFCSIVSLLARYSFSLDSNSKLTPPRNFS